MIKRIVSIFLCIVFGAQLFANVAIAAGEKIQLDESKYDLHEYQERVYQNYQSLLCGSAWDDLFKGDLLCAPITLRDNMKNSQLIQAEISIATLAMNGVDFFEPQNSVELAKEQYYQKALFALLKTMEENLCDAIDNAADYDETMTWLDYFAEITMAVGGAIGTWATASDNVPPIMNKMKTLMDIDGIAINLNQNLLEKILTDQQLESLADQMELYTIFHDTLQAVYSYGKDVRLRQAARDIDEALTDAFMFYWEQINQGVEDFTLDVAGFVLENSLDQILDNKDFLDSVSVAEMQLLKNANELVSSFTAGVDLGVALCDFAAGSANTINAYYELFAMAGAEEALLAAIENQKKSIDSSQDIDKIYQIQKYLYALLYTDVRGIHAVDRLQQKDIKLMHGLATILGLDRDTGLLLDASKEPVKNLKNCVDDIFPDVENFRLEVEDEIYRIYQTEKPLICPTLPADQCVVDDAGVLSQSTFTYFNELNGQLEASCSGAQIALLTVQYTGSATTEEYAAEAFNAWGVGSASENNGVLILLVMESPNYDDGDYYVTYGDGFCNTALANQVLQVASVMENDFAAGDYDAAAMSAAKVLAGIIADIYGVSLTGSATPSQKETSILGTWVHTWNEEEEELISEITFNKNQTFSYIMGKMDSGIADFYQGTYQIDENGFLQLYWAEVGNLDLGNEKININQYYAFDLKEKTIQFQQLSGEKLYFDGVGDAQGPKNILILPEDIHRKQI